MFVQVTKSRRGPKVYETYLVRESFRTAQGPRSRTVCNITGLPPAVRQLITDSLAGQRFLAPEQIALQQALDYGGLAVLVEVWPQLGLAELFAGIGSVRQRSLLQAMIFARLLFPCAKLALAERAAGSLLAPACGLRADEAFDEDELYAAMDALTGHWCALEKGLAAETFQEPLSLVLYDLTSVYFEGKGPARYGRYGHSRDHRGDRPQIILAVATDTRGVPLHLSVLRGHRADTTTLQGFVKILRRRFQIREAVFAFDDGTSSPVARGGGSAIRSAGRCGSRRLKQPWPNWRPPKGAGPTRKRSPARLGAPCSPSKPTNTSPTKSTPRACCAGRAKKRSSRPSARMTAGTCSTPI